MYFCVERLDNNNFSVLDTSDKVIETVSLDTLKGYLSQGVEILGVTLESLSLNDTTIVMVDVKSSRVLTGRMFNGYYFEDYDKSTYKDYENRYLYSVIESNHCDLKGILQYIQKANRGIFDRAISKIPDSSFGYILGDVFDNGLFNVRELGTMIEYGFNYCHAFSKLLNDKLTVQGFSSITPDEVVIDGHCFTLLDALDDELSDPSRNSYYTFNYNKDKDGWEYMSTAVFNSSSLYNFLRDSEGELLTKNLFPKVALFDYVGNIDEGDDDLLKILDDVDLLSHGSYVGSLGHNFSFKEGDIDIARISNYLGLVSMSSPCKQDLDKYKHVIEAKKKLLFNETSDICAFRVDDDYFQGKSKPFKGVLDCITKEKVINYVDTDFGGIVTRTYIRDTEEKCSLDKMGGILMYSISNDRRSNSYYYRIGRSGITIYLSSTNKSHEAKNIASSSFAWYINYFRDKLGYYRHRPCIVPLFVHNVVRNTYGVEINILVAVNTNKFMSFTPEPKANKKKKKSKEIDRRGWGFQLFVVPILITGTHHYFYKDSVVFKMLFQDLIINKDLYNNLTADIKETNDLIAIDKCTEVSSTKLCNCVVGNVSTLASDELRKSAHKHMLIFNKGLKNEGNLP